MVLPPTAGFTTQGRKGACPPGSVTTMSRAMRTVSVPESARLVAILSIATALARTPQPV